jgi:hypothetical protein
VGNGEGSSFTLAMMRGGSPGRGTLLAKKSGRGRGRLRGMKVALAGQPGGGRNESPDSVVSSLQPA